MRQHPKVRALPFKQGLTRVARVNARMQYIEGSLTSQDEALFTQVPEELTNDDKTAFLDTFRGVSVSSDAFSFRDNVDECAKNGVSYIVQPGGSVQDAAVIEACEQHGISMAFSSLRLFHH
jgi:phosphoribosylaminoimidazolecarboxamide formyltransferase / IMP cyclohydrolase